MTIYMTTCLFEQVIYGSAKVPQREHLRIHKDPSGTTAACTVPPPSRGPEHLTLHHRAMPPWRMTPETDPRVQPCTAQLAQATLWLPTTVLDYTDTHGRGSDILVSDHETAAQHQHGVTRLRRRDKQSSSSTNGNRESNPISFAGNSTLRVVTCPLQPTDGSNLDCPFSDHLQEDLRVLVHRTANTEIGGEKNIVLDTRGAHRHTHTQTHTVPMVQTRIVHFLTIRLPHAHRPDCVLNEYPKTLQMSTILMPLKNILKPRHTVDCPNLRCEADGLCKVPHQMLHSSATDLRDHGTNPNFHLDKTWFS